MSRIFGLDIGTTSIGFAVIDHDAESAKGEILRLGVRIFPEPRDPQGTPLNQERRQARLRRRQLHGVRKGDGAHPAALSLADDHDVGAERLELLAGLLPGNFAERDHRYDRRNADHDADKAQHRAQPRPAQAFGRFAGIGPEDR